MGLYPGAVGIIRKRLLLKGARRSRRVEALFDTGATRSLVRRDIAESLGTLVELPEPERFQMVRGEFVTREGFVAGVGLGGARPFHLFCVLEDLSEELIIGTDFLQQWDIRLRPRRKQILVDRRAMRLKAVGGRRKG